MKFLRAEHKDISELLNRKGYNANQYSFRKKRGLLYIEIENREDSFCFYRKTTSELNASMQLVESTAYFIGQKKDKKVELWEDVLALIDNWA